MEIVVHQKLVFDLINVLLARWKSKPKQYPYNRPDAIIPQRIIPNDLRANKETLACFYFYLCIYMRGGIESLQAFTALIKMWRAHPELFDPYTAQWWSPAEVQKILKRFIGWDSKAASINWVENSRRLMRNWSGSPLNILKSLRSYEEALRRIKNKRTKRELREVGLQNEGFRGFQPKMVSMILYFYDWEGWLTPRFLYPSPADFHNFRLGLATGAIVVSLKDGSHLSASERLSAPWRDAVMAYLRIHNADPIEVADALWLYSLVMCGNSPLTVTREKKVRADLFDHAQVEEVWLAHEHERWISSHKRVSLLQTCFVCPFVERCTLAIPSQPYYRKGKLLQNSRPRAERYIDLSLVQEPRPHEVMVDEKALSFLTEQEDPVPA